MLLVAGWMIFGAWATYKWRASEEQLEKIEQENEKIERQLKKEEEKKERKRRKYFSYCRRLQAGEICRDIALSGISIEELAGIKGFSKLYLSISTNESLFKPEFCPDFNCIGAGAYESDHWIKFKSYEEAAAWLADWLKDEGFKEVDVADIRKINQLGYAENPTWWTDITFFWEEIG